MGLRPAGDSLRDFVEQPWNVSLRDIYTPTLIPHLVRVTPVVLKSQFLQLLLQPEVHRKLWCNKSMVLKLPESPGGLNKTQIAGSHPRVSNSVDLEWG